MRYVLHTTWYMLHMCSMLQRPGSLRDLKSAAERAKPVKAAAAVPVHAGMYYAVPRHTITILPLLSLRLLFLLLLLLLW